MASSSQSSSEPALTADDFLRAVLRSRLIKRDQLQKALRDVPAAQREDPFALAEHLIRAGKLSRFQAGKLLKGTALGLMLGPYQILAPIGKGGMGTVYLCRDERSQTLLALKVLPPRRARTEERLLARFRREMEMSQLVLHPHLCRAFDVGSHHGVHYIAMEYIPGKTLSRLVAEQGPLNVVRAARLLAEVAAGMDHAHEQGLIHRDLKPSNIQITPHDHAKVLDLGLALLAGEVGDSQVVGGQGYILGTMDYIAPEQTADAVRVDRRADIYSLGCTLYFALTGQPPFPGGTSKDKIRRHRHEQPTPLAQLRPDLPGGFVVLVERLMAKAPERRPPNAAIAEQELRAWASGAPVLPLDAPTDRTYVEAITTTLQEAGPTEAYRLPVVEEKRAGLPPWLLFALIVGASVLGVGLALALGAWVMWG